MWYDKKKKFLEGVKMISEKLSREELEESLKQIMARDEDLIPNNLISALNYGSSVTSEERLLICKTLLYISQRLKMFLMSPVKLQSDLSELGLAPEKSEIIVKLYSESNRHIIQNLDTQNSSESDVSWTIKTTLADEVTNKCKKAVARVCLKSNGQEIILDELNRSSLGQLFDNLETIQRELDILLANK